VGVCHDAVARAGEAKGAGREAAPPGAEGTLSRYDAFQLKLLYKFLVMHCLVGWFKFKTERFYRNNMVHTKHETFI
jgi:hypothetical protein